MKIWVEMLIHTPEHLLICDNVAALGFHPEHHQSFLLECPALSQLRREHGTQKSRETTVNHHPNAVKGSHIAIFKKFQNATEIFFKMFKLSYPSYSL